MNVVVIGAQWGGNWSTKLRRCGYLDLVALRYVCRVNSISNLVLTHLDIYDTLDESEACIVDEVDGEIVTDFPASIEKLEKAKPILQKFGGWKTPLNKCRAYDELSAAAREYVEFIEYYCATPVGIISVGYERNDTFVRVKPFEEGE